MAVMSDGRPGDQVTLTSVLHEFKEPASVRFDYSLQGSTPETDGTLSVYLLSKQRVPMRLQLKIIRSTDLPGDWKRGCFEIPSGTYHVMFLATLGLQYHSDIYLDNIEFRPSGYCRGDNIKPSSGNRSIIFILHVYALSNEVFVSMPRCLLNVNLFG